MAKKETLGKDTRGVYRRYIGYKIGNGQAAVQHLFRLGRDEAQAKLANARLEQLWEGVVARWKRLRADGKTDDPCPLWNDATLAIGQAVAKGEATCSVSPPPEVSALPVEMQVAWLGRLQADFPIIPLKLPDADVYIRGVNGIRAVIEVKRELLATLKEPETTATLWQGLDAYAAYVAEKYKDKPNNRPQQTAIGLLKRHAENFTLDKLDADKVETWLAYWCRRPLSQSSGKAMAFTTCRNVLIVLRQFVRWLNRSPQFAWSMPLAFSFPRCKIGLTPGDRVKKRATFNLSELKTIWQNAKPWDRALILLALNCGFSKREIATLQAGEIVKGKRHTFIKRHRTKTDVYGEWVLWPETLEALEYLKPFQKPGTDYVVVNTAGKSMEKGTPKGNDNQMVKNHWDNIFKRILADYPEFHKLPFKHLRKTGATLIRHMHVANAAELASMYLSHGEKADSADSLLPVYTSRPWRKLHKVLLKLRKKLLPIFTSVEQPWEFERVRTSPLTVAKVLELRAGGMKLKDIATQVGLHWVTVGKICRKDKAKAAE